MDDELSSLGNNFSLWWLCFHDFGHFALNPIEFHNGYLEFNVEDLASTSLHEGLNPNFWRMWKLFSINLVCVYCLYCLLIFLVCINPPCVILCRTKLVKVWFLHIVIRGQKISSYPYIEEKIVMSLMKELLTIHFCTYTYWN